MKTYVPPVYIRLPDYQFYDSPYSKDRNRDVDPKYMERREIEAQLRARLRDSSSSRSGAILVTGYRGCGKTSMVRKVIRDLTGKPPASWSPKLWFGLGPGRIHAAEINIAQDDIDERKILRLIAMELRRILGRIRLYPLDLFSLILRSLRLLTTLIVAVLFVPYCAKKIEALTPFRAVPAILENGLLTTILDAHNEQPSQPAFVVYEADVVQQTPVLASDGFSWLGLVESALVPFVLAIGCFWVMTKLLERVWPNYMERSVTQLQRRLDVLIARMHSEVTDEHTRGIGPSLPLGVVSIGAKRSTRYPIARTKEVEQEIVDVLRVFGDISRPNKYVKRWCGHWPLIRQWVRQWDQRRIVFVIDELDKLIPHSKSGLNDKDNEDPTDTITSNVGNELRHGSKGYENEWVRRRQESIAALFANLKHFLNDAQAKFVFIGGRELYDAVLADTSNRDAFFSSVFSHVLYVPTFLKEPQFDEHGVIEGLSTTTERFVAERLMTLTYRAKCKNFHISLRDFLQVSLAEQADRLTASARDEKTRRRAKKPKPPLTLLTDTNVLHAYTALNNFCIYLTFRSNGMAKNLVRLFERFIVPLNAVELDKVLRDGETIVCGVGKRHLPGLYLRLDQNEQYAHALLTYLYRPFLSLGSGFYRSLNDKQQVALTYLMDHLVKYHGIAFSYFHLESAPETIAVNKVPDFRKFLTQVLNKFSVQHLRSVDNGLYGFHFYNKIYHEVAFLSKVSELDAAALNFTLDESLPVKQYFYKRLANLIRLDKEKNRTGVNQTLSATADIHQWLGDLHFYDTEHEEALGQFRAAAAYYANDRSALAGTPVDEGGAARMFPEQFNEYVKLTLKQIHCLKKMKALDDALILSTALSSLIIQQLTFFRAVKFAGVNDWRLLALAVATKPAIIAKLSRRGLVKSDLADVHEFLDVVATRHTTEDNLQGPITEHRLLATMSMYMGAVLHYSNRDLRNDQEQQEDDRIVFTNPRYCYRMAMARLLKSNWSEVTPERLDGFVSEPGRSAASLLLMANCLSKYTDALIVEYKFNRRTSAGAFYDLGIVHLFSHPKHGRITNSILLTARAYVAAGQPFQAVFQIKKLFYYLIECTTPRDPLSNEIMAEAERLKGWAKQMVHKYNQHAARQQRSKFVSHTKDEEGDIHRLRDLPKRDDVVSYGTELLELDILFNDLRLRASKDSASLDLVQAFLEDHTQQVSLQFTRARHLILCIRYNWLRLPVEILDQFKDTDLSKLDLSAVADPDALEALVRDSLHCSFQLITILNLLGPSFMTNHSLIALAYEHMGGWCLVHRSMELSISSSGNMGQGSYGSKPKGGVSASHSQPEWRDRAIRIRKSLAKLLDGKVESRLDPLFYYSIALDHSNRAWSVHHGGRSYRDFMGDMFFIEDDYMDNLYHFTCALERMRLGLISPGEQHTVHERQQRALKARIRALEELYETVEVVRSSMSQ